MKSKNLILVIISFCFALTSCEKEEGLSPESTDNPYIATQGYDAEVYSFKDQVIGVGTQYRTEGAIFYGTTKYQGVAATSVDAGVISVNSVILKKLSTTISYMDTTGTISSGSYTLNVSGSSQFPSGSLVYGQNYPAFNDTALVPTSVSLSSGISLQFNNCINSDSLSIQLQDAVGTLVTKRFPVSNNQANITFSGAELTTLAPTMNGVFYVDLMKKNITTVGPKIYGITLERRYAQISVQFN